jgi:hypothetical protein
MSALERALYYHDKLLKADNELAALKAKIAKAVGELTL